MWFIWQAISTRRVSLFYNSKKAQLLIYAELNFLLNQTAHSQDSSYWSFSLEYAILCFCHISLVSLSLPHNFIPTLSYPWSSFNFPVLFGLLPTYVLCRRWNDVFLPLEHPLSSCCRRLLALTAFPGVTEVSLPVPLLLFVSLSLLLLGCLSVSSVSCLLSLYPFVSAPSLWGVVLC